MTGNEELKPCKCGNKVHPHKMSKWYYIWCLKCGNRTEGFDTEKEVVFYWNNNLSMSEASGE